MDVSVDVCVWGGHLWAFAIKSRKDVMVCSFVHDGGGASSEKKGRKKNAMIEGRVIKTVIGRKEGGK